MRCDLRGATGDQLRALACGYSDENQWEGLADPPANVRETCPTNDA